MGSCSARKIQKKISEVKRFARDDIRNYYRFEKVLGSGSFGTVKIGISRQLKKYAVKTINKYKMRDQFYLVQRELEIMTQLDHPNIIKVFEEYEDEMYYHFVMEYCSGGELLERVVQSGYLKEDNTRDIMRQLFSAIQYVHEMGIVHRDLKPENVLFTSQDSDQIKIIDFGLSKKFRNLSQKLQRMNSKVGTPVYVAPEVIQGNYSFQCDEWSLGCIMHVLLCGDPPFNSNNIGDLQTKILNQRVNFYEPQWEEVSQEAKTLIKGLLEKNPKKRLTCLEALDSPWMKLKKQDSIKISQMENEKTIKLLQTYGNASKFKKEALKIMLNQLSEKQIKQLQDTFLKFDKDSNGIVTVEELELVMKQMGNPQTSDQITNLIDKISNGRKIEQKVYIQYSEFLSACANNKEFLNRERLWHLFKYFDYDNKNYITMDDINKAFIREGRQLTESKLLGIFEDIVRDKEGRLDFEAFTQMMYADQDEQERMIQLQDDRLQEQFQKEQLV
ncbi:hypothetical protein pb186bvf_008393 [Paramecium bursaria]